MAEVIPLPIVVREPSCRICVHALVADETYCRLYGETILNERSVARECEMFDDDEEKV